MRIGKVTYNGIASDTLGVFVSGKGSFDAAEMDAVKYEVPGRNGSIIISNDRYMNIEVKYPAFIPGNFEATVQAVRNWMRGAKGYVKLTDNFDTTHYRMAIAKGILTFSPVVQNIAANCQLVFDCKPQRFLTSGDTASSVSTGGTISNPTNFPALPLFTMTKNTSTASLSVTNSLGTFTLTATAARTGDTTIDCDQMNIYNGSTNLNSLFSGTFPILAPGTNTFTVSGFTTLKVTPRWWEL